MQSTVAKVLSGNYSPVTKDTLRRSACVQCAEKNCSNCKWLCTVYHEDLLYNKSDIPKIIDAYTVNGKKPAWRYL
jgi:hypothetical protein